MFIWIRDIKEQTADMNQKQKASYIAEYYWYHILLTFLVFFLLCLTGYHLTFGRSTVSLQVVIINAETDDARDEMLGKKLAELIKVEKEEVFVDSNYQVKYATESEATSQKTKENAETGDIDYTGYDKFFFGWSEGALDMIIMPSGLFDYCVHLGAELKVVNESGDRYFSLEDTLLSSQVQNQAEDPMVVVFPANGKHEEAVTKILEEISV